MPKFLIAYHGNPQFKTKEEGAAHMTAWQAWSQGLGKAVFDRGMPVGMSKTIASDRTVSDGGGPNPLSGITILQAENIDEAIALVKACPHLNAGGTIEVAQAFDMPM
jgi:hypothetical protein